MRSHDISRPGALIGLLAIVALTLLAPVHLVHALQRASAAVSVGCHDGPVDQARHDAAYRYCPVCALAKAAGGLVAPAAPALAGLAATTAHGISPTDAVAPAARRHDPRQARAPPASA